MPLDLPRPIIYLITSGATTNKTTPDSPEFSRLFTLIRAAVETAVPLIQIREKALNARVLFELTRRAVKIAQGTSTRVLVNDRFDVALAADAHGVQLTAQSLPASVVRRATSNSFVIGASTHSRAEVEAAKSGADFILFGPVFETESKRGFGPPKGVHKLGEVVEVVRPLPVIAIGGIALENVAQCLEQGAAGVAAIGLLNDPNSLAATVRSIREVIQQ